MTRIQLSSTFTIEEVHLILMLERTLRRGGDVSVIIRHPAWRNLLGKFERMGQKHQNGTRAQASAPISDRRLPTTEPEPIEKPAPDPNLEGDLPNILASDSDRQHFLDQGYTLTEVEQIMRQLKKS
jgi:hypothetical protein